MELWGSSYLLQDVTPIGLIATLGSSTPDEATGSVRVSFTQEPGVFTTTQAGSECTIIVKWDVAVRLIALLHVLVLQNMLLRGERPELIVAAETPRVFKVTGGSQGGPIVCSWAVSAAEVSCESVTGGNHQFELILKEEAATELTLAIAERIASNGTATARHRSGRTDAGFK